MLFAWEAIKQRCKRENDWDLSRLERWFYTIKLLICIVLRRPDLTDPYGAVHVAITGGGSYQSMDYGTIYWYEAVVVGRGIRTGWRYSIYSDGG